MRGSVPFNIVFNLGACFTNTIAAKMTTGIMDSWKNMAPTIGAITVPAICPPTINLVTATVIRKVAIQTPNKVGSRYSRIGTEVAKPLPPFSLRNME